MPRPIKKRHICCAPMYDSFGPLNSPACGKILLTLDEYEAIRLIDLEKVTQQQCAQQMQVSRTTVQGIYDMARQKVAEAIIYGRQIYIAGGDYVLCPQYGTQQCGRGSRCSCSHLFSRQIDFFGGNLMKIAVTYDNGQVFQHFGHTEQFKIYNISNNIVDSTDILETLGSGHGALADFLHTQNVDTLICGGIGAGAQQALAQVGIRLFGGVSGDADEAVTALLNGKLVFDPDVHCEHHHEEDNCSSGAHSCHCHD